MEEIADLLRVGRSQIVDAQWADNGPGWIVVLLGSAAAVLELDPVRAYAERIDLGVVGPYPSGHPLAFEVRAFFTDHNKSAREDPVTGSLNAAVAQWLLATGLATAPCLASQGTCLGRTGRIDNAIARQFNERPRKTLGFHTPAEMFSECVASTG